jgi:TonB family protein
MYTALQKLVTQSAFYGSGLLLLVCGSFRAQAQALTPEVGGSKLSAIPPQLPEGGGLAMIVRAIQQRVTYPMAALRYGIQGQSRVTFAVAPDGQIRWAKIANGIQPDMDSVVVRAVRQLPRLTPAMQYGKPVACLMTAPITFSITEAPGLRKKSYKLPAADSTQLYTAVTHMPLYQGKASYSQLSADLVAEYLQLQTSGGCPIPRTGLGILLTVGPSGTISNIQLTKGNRQYNNALRAEYGDAVMQREEGEERFSAACVETLVKAAQRVPRLEPAQADNKRVAMQLQLTLPGPRN